ncbi:MAG TPA: NAD(P)H-dependent oxidoreductase subunit E [Anaerovoracaceae bacterium]|nr:NAD(P)H-dependent oxidoreductase subunit E [Anaerovoracaceae bacterium]
MVKVYEKNRCKEMTESEKYALLDNIIKDYDKKESNLIQILHIGQVIFGCLPLEVQIFIAERMDLLLSKVSGKALNNIFVLFINFPSLFAVILYIS